MKSNGIVRRIDDCGRVVIPKEIRNALGIKDGDPLEFITNYNNKELVIRPYKKSFEECAMDWLRSHSNALGRCYFRTEGDYTFCIVRNCGTPTRAGYAKRFKADAWNPSIGKIASYARAMGRNLNKMIGYEG